MRRVERKRLEAQQAQKAQKKLIAYTDGSYKDGIYGYGVRIGMEVEIYAGGQETYGSANVTGECFAAIRAMDYAVKHKATELLICHDFEGVAKWATGEWKIKKSIAKTYVEYVNKYREAGLKISFKKIVGHSGVTGNEIADCLASAGIEHFRKTGSNRPVIYNFYEESLQKLIEKSNDNEYYENSEECRIFSNFMADRGYSMDEDEMEFSVGGTKYMLECDHCCRDSFTSQQYNCSEFYVRYTISRNGVDILSLVFDE